MAGDAPLLRVGGVTVTFGPTRALYGVELKLFAGEIVALLGPSGCGKSTLLRAVAGLQPLDSGSVVLDGHDLAGTAPHRRGMGLMFQTHSLFPHRTVAQNVVFGLELRGDNSVEMSSRVQTMLESVGLGGYGDRKVDTLSGGESQRVALARTLAPEPSLVMLDEPMGSLDRLLRERLAIDIREALRSEGVTAIVVTHDQDEAFTIADRVAIMRAGTIERIGTPLELRRSPGSAFVAEFLGMDVFIDTEIEHAGRFDLFGIAMERSDWPRGRATIVVPPEAVQLSEDTDATNDCQIVGSPRFRGDHFLTEVSVDGHVIAAHLLEPIRDGAAVSLSIDSTRLARLDR